MRLPAAIAASIAIMQNTKAKLYSAFLPFISISSAKTDMAIRIKKAAKKNDTNYF